MNTVSKILLFPIILLIAAILTLFKALYYLLVLVLLIVALPVIWLVELTASIIHVYEEL